MNWIQLTIRTTSEGSEVVAELFMEAGAKGTLIEDKCDFVLGQQPADRWDLVDPELIEAMSDDCLVKAYFPEDERINAVECYLETRIEDVLGLDLPFDLGPMTLARDSLNEQDWAENWKRYYKPLRAGKTLVVKPSWEAYEPCLGDRVIEMDPGMAFGTGTHETTAMCLELVERLTRQGDKVLDIGTGTGILAIAAALMGAEGVLAIDMDPVAVRVARENARVNGVDSVVSVREGDLLSEVPAKYDLIVANIIADVIIKLTGDMAEFLATGGAFVCSGIICDRRLDVLVALDAAGFYVVDELTMGEWVTLCARVK